MLKIRMSFKFYPFLPQGVRALVWSLALLGFGMVLLSSCQSSSSDTGVYAENETVPSSTGPSGEIYVITDTTVYKGPVGDALRDIFNQALPALINTEPAFTLNKINPIYANELTRRYHNIIYVYSHAHQTPMSTRLRKQFQESTIQKLEKDTNLLVFRRKNQYSKPQNILYVLGRNDQVMADYLTANESYLFQMMRSVERKYKAKLMYRKGYNKKAMKKVKATFPFSMKIPKGYKVAKAEKNILWIREPGPEMDHSLLMTTVPYTDTAQFSRAHVEELVDSVMRHTIFGSGEEGDSSTAMIVEERQPLYVASIQFNGHYAREIRGIWKLRNNLMGGVFLSYLFLDEQRQQLVYLQGSVYAPNQSKRERLRELEAILHSLKLKNNKTKKSADAA